MSSRSRHSRSLQGQIKKKSTRPRRCVRQHSTVADNRLHLQVIAVCADGDHAALGRGEHLRAGVAPALSCYDVQASA